MKSILFVCLGNICRSPVAEAVARAEFARAGLAIAVASAGIGDYHIGQGADARAVASAHAHGYDLSAHRARQIADVDFGRFDALLAMDRANLRALVACCPQRYSGKLALFCRSPASKPLTKCPIRISARPKASSASSNWRATARTG